jgi:hypothetical protein
MCLPMALKAGLRTRWVQEDCGSNCLRKPVVVTNKTTTLSKPNTAFFNFEESSQKPPVLKTRGSSMIPLSISQSDMVALMAPGNYQRIRANNMSYTMDIGIADNMNPQTWTVPVMTFTNGGVEYFIDPNEVTPASAQAPNATHVARSTFLDNTNTLVTRYAHYQLVNGDELDELGETYVENGVTVGDYDSAPQIYTDAPLDLNDAFTTNTTEYEDEDPLPRIENESDIVVDAFGSIVTPFGTYDCLRMSITETVENYTVDPMTPSSTTTTYKVAWVTKEGFRLYVTKPSESASGSITVGNPYMYDVGLATALPVELTEFLGENTEGGNQLTWTTASEKNNAGFEIQRSRDGKTFEKIGFVKGNGTTAIPHQFTFLDGTPPSNTTYYRLRQVDTDGKGALSNVITVEEKSASKGLKIYPNPSNSGQITLEMGENTEGVIVTDAIGRIVFQQKSSAVSILTIDVNAWANGLYFIKSGQEVVKFLKN